MKSNETSVDVACELNSEAQGCSASQSADDSILLELGSMGAGHAATSLSQVLHQRIEIAIPQIRKIAPHLLPQIYRKYEEVTTAIHMQLSGSECDILLLFQEHEAKKIAALMMASPAEALDPEMESSAIQELGNIIIGAFMNAISDFTGLTLVLTTPQRVVDTFDAILDNFLAKQSLTLDEVMIFDAQFRRAGEAANSIIMIFPSPQLQEMLVNKSKELLGAQQ